MTDRARRLVLASASPRRMELMRAAGLTFDVVVPEVEEAHDAALSCEELTVENARRKASAGLAQAPDALVIGADTLVYLDGIPFGKPADLDEARSMLHRLSGKKHAVCTGVAMVSADSCTTFATITEVEFHALTEQDIQDYLSLVHVLDKAGAYAVQEHGDRIVRRVSGSLSNVIGLPMEELSRRLT
jgi:septum formation protein